MNGIMTCPLSELLAYLCSDPVNAISSLIHTATLIDREVNAGGCGGGTSNSSILKAFSQDHGYAGNGGACIMS